jgi:hypothetical protein
MNEKTEKRLVACGAVVWFTAIAVSLLASLFDKDELSNFALLCGVVAYAAAIGLVCRNLRKRQDKPEITTSE